MKDMKAVFNKLAPGDVINKPDGSGWPLLVLSAKEGGKKHMGTICGCGKHVNGIPDLFFWDDVMGYPITTAKGAIPSWGDLEILKGEKIDLANKFSTLAINGVFSEAIKHFDAKDPRVVTATKILAFSNTDEFASEIIIAMRAIDISVTDEQAAIMIEVINAIVRKDDKLTSDISVSSLMSMLIKAATESRGNTH
jgi:hypothetical protein